MYCDRCHVFESTGIQYIQWVTNTEMVHKEENTNYETNKLGKKN